MTNSKANSAVMYWTRMLLIALAIACTPAGAADDQSERRVLIGVKLFPALLAADQELDVKREADGRLRIVVLFKEDGEVAREAAARLSAVKAIRNQPLRVSTLPYSRLTELDKDVPAALFLAEWSPDDLACVVRYGIAHRRIVFSPFLGDVTKGASAGIFVGDRILPLINPETLTAAGIALKPFLLEVARTNE
ncbi:MAG: hypothetical protein AB7U81_14640 [Thiohalomonadaceae bacterium]